MAFIAAQGALATAGAVDEAQVRWLVVVRGLAAGALLALFWRHYTELRSAPRTAMREWPLAVAVGLAVFAAWITFDSGWAVFGRGGPGFVARGADGRIDWTLAALRFAGLAAIVPVIEELFWRSFLMRWIDRRDFLAADPRTVTFFAIALSSGLFALEHSQWFAGLIAGAAYGWLYRRSGNLWIPVLSHAVTNGTLGFWILATDNWRFW